MGRLNQREDGRVGLGADSVTVDRAAAWLERLRVGLRQVGANRLPALALVGALENDIAADIEGVCVVGRDHDWVGPGEAVAVLDRAMASHQLRPGCDQPNLLGAVVVALETVAAAWG